MTPDEFMVRFEQFADAPNAVAKMRELVLSLAVKGCLAPQDESEEPASSLLARLQRERSIAVKSGDLRPPKLGVAKDAASTLKTLPPGWSWTTLGELSLLVTSGSRDWAEHYSDDGAIFVRMGNLSRNSYRLRLEKIQRVTPPATTEGTRTKLESGDILVSITGEVGLLGLIPENFGDAYINQHTCLVRLPKDLQNRFIPEFLRSSFAQKQFNEPQRGMKNSFRLTDVTGMLVPLPPLAEQKRIVAKVDELMALCDRLEAQQQERETRHAALARASLARFAAAPTPANLDFLFHHAYTISPDELRKAILTLAVRGRLVLQNPGDEPADELIARLDRELTPEQRRRQAERLSPLTVESLQYELPGGWKWARFRDVAIIASNLVKPDDFLDFTHLAPDNIEKGNGLLLPCKTVREDKVISSNHRFYPGHIIYSKIRPNLAKVVVVDFEGLCSADMYPIDALIDPIYLQRYMLSESFLVQAVKTDTRVAMPKINQMELNAIAVPVPPLPEQRRIVAKVDQMMALVDQLETQLTESRATATRLMDAIVAELTGRTTTARAVTAPASPRSQRGQP